MQRISLTVMAADDATPEDIAGELRAAATAAAEEFGSYAKTGELYDVRPGERDHWHAAVEPWAIA